MDTKKITRKDLKIIDATLKVKAIEIDGKIINLTPLNYGHIENYITHEDCSVCGEEFEKNFTYQKKCSKCEVKKEAEIFKSFKLVEWDHKTPLYLFDSTDQYFFSEEEVYEYCDDEEIDPSELQVVLCSKSSFAPVELDYLMQDGEIVHEDWEPSQEFEDKLKEFNEWLVNQNTNTWFPTDLRIKLEPKP